MDEFLKICGALTVVGGAALLLLKLYRWFFPVVVSIAYTIRFKPEEPDSLAVTIVNRSAGSIYVEKCVIRCTYSFWALTLKHLRNPFLRPQLYPNLRYNSAVYEFVGEEPIKLEPGQSQKLEKNIFEHPLNALYGPMLIAFVTLTDGRKSKSKRVLSPPVWRMIGSRGKTSAQQGATADVGANAPSSAEL